MPRCGAGSGGRRRALGSEPGGRVLGGLILGLGGGAGAGTWAAAMPGMQPPDPPRRAGHGVLGPRGWAGREGGGWAPPMRERQGLGRICPDSPGRRKPRARRRHPEGGCRGSLAPRPRGWGRSPGWAPPAVPAGMICRIGAQEAAVQIPEPGARPGPDRPAPRAYLGLLAPFFLPRGRPSGRWWRGGRARA